jgi:hypothetical protein
VRTDGGASDAAPMDMPLPDAVARVSEGVVVAVVEEPRPTMSTEGSWSWVRRHRALVPGQLERSPTTGPPHGPHRSWPHGRHAP